MDRDADAALGSLSRRTRLVLGIVVGLGLGGVVGLATGNVALWLPAFAGVGVALGDVFATRE